MKKNRKPRLIKRAACSAFLYALLTPPAMASVPDYFEVPVEQLLSAEVVSVSKKAEKVSEAPAAVYVITNEDIIRSGVTTIPDALRMAPGVHVAQSDANSWAVSIRGFNNNLTNKLLVLIDGRTVYNPLFGGVFWEIQDVVLEDIDRIEVIRGPGGTLWGANAVNGVINIITKSAKDTQGNLVTTAYGNQEHGIVAARHGGAFKNDDGHYRVFAKGFNRDESRSPAGGEAYDGWHGYRSGFRADWKQGLTLQGDVYRTDTDQLRNDLFLTAPTSVLRQQNIQYEGANLLGRWTKELEGGAGYSIQSYLDYTRRDEPYNFVDNRIVYDLETQYNLARQGRHEMVVGAGYRFLADNEKGNRNTSFTPAGRRDNLYNAFVQDKITLVPEAWFLTLGSKFEHNAYSGVEIQPNARLQWFPDQQQAVWASVSRAVRTPTPLEEDTMATLVTAPGIRAAIIGNEGFQSEELMAYEMGYRNQLAPNLSLDLATFYNNYSKLATIDFLAPSVVNDGTQPPYLLLPLQFGNEMSGKTYGVELATSWSVTPDFKVSANYSFMRLFLDALNNSTLAQEGAEGTYPMHQPSIRTSWNINKNWTMDTATFYMDRLRGDGVDSHLRFDVNLGMKINDGLRFNLVGQNLIGDPHREFLPENDINAAEIPRSVFGKLTWQF